MCLPRQRFDPTNPHNGTEETSRFPQEVCAEEEVGQAQVAQAQQQEVCAQAQEALQEGLDMCGLSGSLSFILSSNLCDPALTMVSVVL